MVLLWSRAGPPARRQPASLFVGTSAARERSQGDPDQHNDHVHALALAPVVLVRPHAIRLLVPESTRRAVHAPAADMGLAVGRGRGRLLGVGAGADARFLARGAGTAGLVELGRGDEVLDDGAVDSKLEGGVCATGRGRLGDDGLQDGVLVKVNRRLAN